MQKFLLKKLNTLVATKGWCITVYTIPPVVLTKKCATTPNLFFFLKLNLSMALLTSHNRVKAHHNIRVSYGNYLTLPSLIAMMFYKYDLYDGNFTCPFWAE